MTGSAEKDRIIRDRDDLAMMKNPDIWPNWPVLPLKNHRQGEPGGFPKLGFLLEAKDCEHVIFFANMFMIRDIDFKNCPRQQYESFEAEVADGWIVD